MEYYFQRQLNARRMRLASRVVGTPGVQNIKWPFLYRQIFVRILTTRQQETFLFFIVLLRLFSLQIYHIVRKFSLFTKLVSI